MRLIIERIIVRGNMRAYVLRKLAPGFLIRWIPRNSGITSQVTGVGLTIARSPSPPVVCKNNPLTLASGVNLQTSGKSAVSCVFKTSYALAPCLFRSHSQQEVLSLSNI